MLAVVWCVEEASYAECAAWWGCDDREVVTLSHSVKELVEKGVAKNVVLLPPPVADVVVDQSDVEAVFGEEGAEAVGPGVGAGEEDQYFARLAGRAAAARGVCERSRDGVTALRRRYGGVVEGAGLRYAWRLIILRCGGRRWRELTSPTMRSPGGRHGKTLSAK